MQKYNLIWINSSLDAFVSNFVNTKRLRIMDPEHLTLQVRKNMIVSE
jgi:hypothetical protein